MYTCTQVHCLTTQRHTGVQMHELPPDTLVPDFQIPDPADAEPPDVRLSQYARDHLVVKENELYESDRDQFGE